MPKLKSLILGLACAVLAASGIASAQTVSIVSGNGQAVCTWPCAGGGQGVFDPLVVMVKDANGNPSVGTPVFWQVPAGSTATLSSDPINTTSTGIPYTMTGSDGTASVTFSQTNMSSLFNSQPVQSTTVTATVYIGAATPSVNFYETLVMTDSPTTLNPLLVPNLDPMSVPAAYTFTGNAGQPSTTPIIINVGAPNVSVRLALPSDAPANSPTVACSETTPGMPTGTVLSDINGKATCTPVFSGVGTGNFLAWVGGKYTSFQFASDISAGLPCLITIVNGNNQTGNPGQQLPGVLTATVADCGGIPLPGVAVVWGPVSPAGGATFIAPRTATSFDGRVSTYLKLGSVGGTITIPVSVASGVPTDQNHPTVSANFTATVTGGAVTGFTKSGGDGQSAPVNTPFANPLTVQVNLTDASGHTVPASGVAVTFAVASGSVPITLNPTTPVTTNAQGQASVNVTAGATQGQAAVTASISGQTLRFALAVGPAGPTNLTFFNSAWSGPGTNDQGGWKLSPCGLATVTGSGLVPGIQGTLVPVFFGPWLLKVSNLQIQFGNSPAPIFSVSNSGSQEVATFQVPCEVTPGNVQVTVTAGSASKTATVEVLAAAPGIFETTYSDGKPGAVIMRPDGSFAGLGDTYAPYIRRGEIVHMYVTGMGNLVQPAVSTNSLGNPNSPSKVADLNNVIVGVNDHVNPGQGVRVVSAAYAPGQIGVYEVVFQVPDNLASGDNIELITYIGGVWSNASRIAVQ